MKKPAYVSKGFVFFVLSVVFLWGVCAWILLDLHNSSPTCNESYRQDKTITINGHKLSAQTATTSDQLQTGLSGRSCIGQNQAMLFVFNKSGYYPFWMKDMKFNLDIAWVSADKQVVDVQKNLAPGSYPKSYTNTEPAKYVIEMGAGGADSLGFNQGATLNF